MQVDIKFQYLVPIHCTYTASTKHQHVHVHTCTCMHGCHKYCYETILQTVQNKIIM